MAENRSGKNGNSSQRSKNSSSGRKNSGQRGNGSTGRHTGNTKNAGRQGNGRRNTKQTQQRNGNSGNRSDHLTNFFLLLLLVTIIVMAVLYFKNKPEDKETNAPTPSVVPQESVTPSIGEGGGKEPVKGGDTKPSPTTPVLTPVQEVVTKVPSVTPEVTENVTLTPQITDTVSDFISEAEADEILADVFWEKGYRFTLSDDSFSADNMLFYRYDAFYGGNLQSYDVLVQKKDGTLYYYEDGKLREFDGVPKHEEHAEPGEEISQGAAADGIVTADRAAELLKTFSYTELGLPAALDECSLVLDNWKTVVGGVECSCLNVFYNGALAGSIYFTEDASYVYYVDEFGEFVAVH